MRYCPNLSCPHRLRVAWPAEFFDHVAQCSDCRSRLVASEDDAIAGRQPAVRDPYRMPGVAPKQPEPVAVRRSADGDAVLSVALIVVGLLVMVLSYSSPDGSGVRVIAWAPVLLGAFLLVRKPPAKPPVR